MLIAAGLASLQGIWNLFTNEPLFPYIAKSVPLWPRVILLAVFCIIAILGIVVVIRVFRYTSKTSRAGKAQDESLLVEPLEIDVHKHLQRKIEKQGYFPIDIDFTLKVPRLPIQLAKAQLCIADEKIDPITISPTIPRMLEANVETYIVKYEPTYNQFLKGRVTPLTREEELKLMVGSSIRKAIEYKAHLLLHIGGKEIESQEFIFDHQPYRSQ